MTVFLSHSCKDHDLDEYVKLRDELTRAAVPLWDERERLRLGKGLSDQLRNAIRDCQTCVFLATPNSMASKWCRAELGAFWYAHRTVIIYTPDPNVNINDLPQFHGLLHSDKLEQVVRDTKRAWEDAKMTPSFGLPLWQPFKDCQTTIVVPRISLRDSWNLNSEEVTLLLGPLRFLNLGVGKDTAVRLREGSNHDLLDKHLIVLGAPHLANTEWSSGSGQSDRTVHSLMLDQLRLSLPAELEIKLYRTIVRGSNPNGSCDQAISGISVLFKNKSPEELKHHCETQEISGKVTRDCGVIARMTHPLNKDRKSLWAFGFTAPGTRAALEAQTQKVLSERICGKNIDNFVSLFEVEFLNTPPSNEFVTKTLKLCEPIELTNGRTD